jgi:Mg2+-importing ATPase
METSFSDCFNKLDILLSKIRNFNTLFGEYTIPTDGVDADWLTKPSKWAIGEIQRFILFIGPISSIFDYLTFFIMLYVFNAWTNPALFHSGWFVEGSAVQAYKKRGLPMAPGIE